MSKVKGVFILPFPISEELLKILSISLVFSIIMFGVIQKIKSLNIIKKEYHIWFINFLLSIIIGISFGSFFYHLTIIESLWISFFSFLGSPTIYELLKNQSFIKYTPKSIKDLKDE